MRTAILGASGLVGRTMLSLLERQPWVEEPPLVLTSARSAGERLPFRGEELVCRDVETASFEGIRIGLFSAGAMASRRWAPVATRAGVWVVDNSSAWRRETEAPLVVPEANGNLVPLLEGPTAVGGIIANPNCSTIQIALPCAALERAFGLREVHVTTMQAVSGAGQQGLEELRHQASGLADGAQAGAEHAGKMFPRRIAANVVPEIGGLGEDGFFEEEHKVHFELRKILDRSDLAVTCTAVRVPVWNGHAAAVRVVMARDVDRGEVVAALEAFPGMSCDESAGD